MRAFACLAVVVGAAAHHARPAPPVDPVAARTPGMLAYAVAHTKWKKRPVLEGTVANPLPAGACPAGMSNVSDRFCIDRWEASLEELGDDGGARPWPHTSTLDPTKRYRAVSVAGVFPQGYVSGKQADDACRAAGKRLCDAAEWRFACGGRAQAAHPYGRTYVAGRCNDHGHSPMAWFYPEVKDSWALVTNTQMNDPRLNAMEGTLARTGEHADCVNDFGAFDMEGNLHEWTADPHGTFQGGYYLDTRGNGEGCAYRTSAHDFDYRDYSTGFRCCADRIGDDDLP